MRAVALVVLVGCGAPVAQSGSEPTIETSLEGVGEAGGTLVVQVATNPELDVSLPEPQVQGLTFRQVGEPLQERVGDQLVVTTRYRFTGPANYYEVPPMELSWHVGDEAHTTASSPLFVDLGKPALEGEDIGDIAEPPVAWRVPWEWGLVGAGAALLAGTGLAVAVGLGMSRRAKPDPGDPPDVVALRAWEAVRLDDTLNAYEKSVEISRIFREYVEAVLQFPAASWTSTEILAHLQNLAHLAQGNVPRAKRLLRATDRVKYAEAAVTDDFFEELDADLRAFVASTRPTRWED